VADVFSTILSQNSSKFQKCLVDSGLALQAQVNYQTLKYAGPVRVIVIPNPMNVAKCFEVLKEQIVQWDSPDYITDEQLDNVKRQMEINHLKEFDVTSSLPHTVGYWWCSADLDYWYSYLSNIRKVTKTDIQNYVRKYIKGQSYCAGLLINAAQKDQLNPDSFWKE
jgi:zinc protease